MIVQVFHIVKVFSMGRGFYSLEFFHVNPCVVISYLISIIF